MDCGEMSSNPLEINVKCIFLNIFINYIRSQVNNVVVKYANDANCRSLWKCVSYYGKDAEVTREIWKMSKKQKAKQFFQIYFGKVTIDNIFAAKTIGNLNFLYDKNNGPTCADICSYLPELMVLPWCWRT